jgi:elongation factor P
MKISGVDIRPGNIIEYEGGIWRAVKIQHTQPGKGGAYMQVEMKNLVDGRKTCLLYNLTLPTNREV